MLVNHFTKRGVIRYVIAVNIATTYYLVSHLKDTKTCMFATLWHAGLRKRLYSKSMKYLCMAEYSRGRAYR